jgi:hypothetical protein
MSYIEPIYVACCMATYLAYALSQLWLYEQMWLLDHGVDMNTFKFIINAVANLNISADWL